MLNKSIICRITHKGCEILSTRC